MEKSIAFGCQPQALCYLPVRANHFLKMDFERLTLIALSGKIFNRLLNSSRVKG